MRKTYKNLIIQYMKNKSAYIASFGIESPSYFNEQDEANIKKWTKAQAKEILEQLIGVMTLDVGFTNCSCPFCLYHNDYCDECSYQEVHQECFTGSDDLYKIATQMCSLEEYENSLEEYENILYDVPEFILTKAFYKKEQSTLKAGYDELVKKKQEKENDKKSK